MTDPFAVAAGHDLTAETAADVLRAGGSAVDAAIAGALTACVAEPVLASLFGGGFLMVREASGRVRLLDFFVQTPRRRAPDADVDLRAIEANFGEATQVFHIGAGSIAAPGVARGLAEAHAHYGVIPFDDLAAPAIRAAKEGIALTPFQAGALEIVTAIYAAAPETRALFGDGETLLKAGETFRNARLADVMEVFVAEGDRFMQEGEAAQSLLSLDGGHLTPADLRDYRAIWREPLEEARATRSGPARIHLNPPPALGGALIAFALRLIEPGDRPVDIARAFEATSRARLEADLNRDPAAGALRLLAPDLTARYRRELAGIRSASRGTTHISAIDGAGLGAALTLSNGAGSGVIAPGLGIMPNNMLGEEDLAGPDLDWAPDRRLSSMMAPMAVEWPDGRAAMLGSGGSNRIRTALTQALLHIIDGEARLEDAIAAPRVHLESAEAADFEDRFRGDARAALLSAYPEARPWRESSMFFGGVHAVSRDAKGGVEAAGDPRREGAAVTGESRQRRP